MGGPFDWGKNSKDGAGKGGELPRHIERMNEGTKGPKMKKSGDGNNLPWGGEPKEKAKAYQSGPPKDKGSMISKLGERGKGAKAMQGKTPMVKSAPQSIKGKK